MTVTRAVYKALMPPVSATRLVDLVWISREPIPFRALCERAIPPETRLVVFDLDRTLHLGRNMGELLGWEISAFRGYGPRYLEDLEPRRPAGRMFLSLRRPLAMLRYLWLSGRVWALPGLYYLLWCKIASRVRWMRRWTYARFGPEPVHAVQRLPQDVLFSQIASLPRAIVRELAARVWARHVPDLTVEREDLAWLRRRSPGVRIVLSSASPREIAEVAARELGFDEVIASSPGVINGGRAKLAGLRARYPELFTPDAVTVGLSDTGYGEDHCWIEGFTHLVDVNSASPFPPIVPATSPLRAVFSSLVLTRAEKEARRGGTARRTSRRGHVAPLVRAFELRELEVLLAAVRAAMERLAASTGAPASELAYRLAILRERARRILDRHWNLPAGAGAELRPKVV